MSADPSVTVEMLGAALRAHTRQAHADIDQHPLLRPLVSSHITLTQYADALAGLHALYAVLEPALGPQVRVGEQQFDCRYRSHLIEQDLAEMADEHHAAWPDQGGLADLSLQSAEERLGVLYVLEGSALGGDMIFGRLQTTLPAAPMRFFAIGGQQARARWGQFQIFLQAASESTDPAQVLASAERCFVALRCHLDAYFRHASSTSERQP